MKRKLLAIILLAAIATLSHVQIRACTTFCIKSHGKILVGKNYDFYVGGGHVMVNKRNVVKTSFDLPRESKAQWTSKYGSVTFNQFGREFPLGGINEKGLVVEIMWLADTRYPDADQRAGLAELQWVQYQLDNAATTDEVITSDRNIRISKISAPVHFLICDAKGNVATIEFINGKMVLHKDSDLPVDVLTNDTYDGSLGYVNSLSSLQEHCANSKSTSSFDRFARAAYLVQQVKTADVTGYAFEILEEVRQGNFTKWKIVYNITDMTIHFKTNLDQLTRKIKLNDFDFGCNAQSLIADVNNPIQSRRDFQVYTLEMNREMIFRTHDELAGVKEFAAFIPPKVEQELVARYPDTMTCNNP